ncbi:MAG: serine/threonine-protein phosphatase [Oxalobacteraceae bacterium]|jgi:protein phosphatase|nr:serine/threonine-protein phosphatase [Oxalobacteraceae bacterium]
MRFSIYQDSQVGGRSSNQDRMGYSFTREAVLLMLADGMGGHSHGEIAAVLALQAMGELFKKAAQPSIAEPEAFLEELVFTAHLALHRYRAEHRLADTPRTTIVVCLIQQGQAQWIHCGDSRLYWLRGGRILARTIDHSHVERLISIGRLPPYESARHPDRNKLYNCLGAPTLPGIDRSGAVPLRAGDQLLLCSDGLWNSIPEHQLAYRLSVSPLEQAVPEMVSSAVIAGGKTGDNVTVLAFTWLDSGDSGAHASDSALLTDGMPHDRVITSIQSSPPGATGSGSEGALAEIERALARMRSA